MKAIDRRKKNMNFKSLLKIEIAKIEIHLWIEVFIILKVEIKYNFQCSILDATMKQIARNTTNTQISQQTYKNKYAAFELYRRLFRFSRLTNNFSSNFFLYVPPLLQLVEPLHLH